MTDVSTDQVPLTERKQKSMSQRRLLARAASVVILVSGLLIWEALSRAGVLPEIILPAPTEIIGAAGSILTSSFLYPHLWSSVSAAVIGFFAGSLLALALGIPIGSSALLRQVFNPFVVVFQTIPKITLAPVFIVWFGFGALSKIVLSTVICFFPVFVNTVSGLSSLDHRAVNMMRALGASRFRMLTKLALPTALPSIFAGLGAATTLAVIGVVASEFVASSRGLGYLISLNSFQLRTATVFVLIGLYAIFGWLLFAVVDITGRRVVFWHATSDEWGEEKEL